jgi:guanylate kinase
MITLFNASGEAVNVVIHTDSLKELQERNRARVEEAKKAMGSKYLLHPSNMRTRLAQPR